MTEHVGMTAAEFDAWVEALESGEYKQGEGRLYAYAPDGDMYCCLGVFCKAVKGLDMYAPAPDGEGPIGAMSGVAFAPKELLSAVDEHQRATLAVKNDNGKSFTEIAAYLREHRDEFVTEATA